MSKLLHVFSFLNLAMPLTSFLYSFINFYFSALSLLGSGMISLLCVYALEHWKTGKSISEDHMHHRFLSYVSCLQHCIQKATMNTKSSIFAPMLYSRKFTGFNFIFILFYVYGCFVCMSVHCMYAILKRVRRPQIF